MADFNNNRTLLYLGPLGALPGAVTASKVFGQADDFKTNLCNFGGGGPSAASECGPTGVVTNSSLDVLVADFNNNRVVDYDPPHFSPRSLSFGTVRTGSAATRTLYLVNTQGVWLNKVAIGLSGPAQFTITKNGCPAHVAPHTQCAITVAFKPRTSSAVGAKLIARDDASSSPQSAALSGK